MQIESILFCNFLNDIWFTLFNRAMIIKWFVHDIQPCDTIAVISFGRVTVCCCVHAARKMNFRMWQKWHLYGKIQRMVCISFFSLFVSFCSVDFTQSEYFLIEIWFIGEMMMSLLWYYRPEHTEQGRQPNDCLDEVFASKHQDHNSVACIEDKCYVLTFNEYCR